LNFFERLIRNKLLHHRFLECVLFSSGSANLCKVQLLIAIHNGLQRCQLNRNKLLHPSALEPMLLSSQIANRRKVVLLIAIKDRARAPHEQKADPLVKSKLKRTAVSSSGSLAASTSNVRLLLAAEVLIESQQAAAPVSFCSLCCYRAKVPIAGRLSC